MRAYKKIMALGLALLMALCWSGLALAADAKKMDRTEIKKENTVKKADKKIVDKSSKPEPKAKAAKKKPPAKKKAAKKKPPRRPININTASEKELQQLAGVGPKYAKAIADYRKKHGKFKKPEDIMKVKGIGKKTFGKNKALIKIK